MCTKFLRESRMNKGKNPVIRVSKDGPLIVKDLKTLRNSKGAFIETKNMMVLCRCGESVEKPFCNGAHIKKGFLGSNENTHPAEEIVNYEGKNIIIHDKRGLCSHIGHCILILPEVFRKGKNPWINPDAADPEKIAKVIRTCPSGALSYTVKGEYCKDYPHEPEIFLVKNGPYNVIGGIDFEDPDDSKPETQDHYALCRCGKSKRKPFCDGTHINTEFKDRIN